MLVRARGFLFPWICALALVGLAAPATRAAVPNTISYQGVLTDGSGNPVADGSYQLAFKLYTAASGGAGLWSEIQPAVPVSKGSFSVLLGSVNPLTIPFDQPCWLGVSVNGGAELTPRVALASSPYALSLRTPFLAASNDSTPTLWAVNPSGWDALRVSSSFKIYPDGANPALQQLYDPTGNPGLQLMAGGNSYDTSLLISNPNTGAIPAYLGTAAGHPGTNFGNLLVGGLTNSRFLKVDGYNGGSGDPKLTIQSGVSNIVLDSHQAGDGAVQLPAGSIGPSEMWGLPGISEHFVGNSVAISSVSSMQDVDTTTITVPTAGYVVVEASSEVVLSGLVGTFNYVNFQIDETAGGPWDPAHGRLVGYDSEPNTGSTYFNVATSRTYFKAPGTYTFRLESARANVSGTAYFYAPTITATFYPASYGAVQAAVTAPELSQFERATPLTTGGAGAPQGVGAGTVYSVDLRELELKAARAREQATRAELDLARAQAGTRGATVLAPTAASAAAAR